LNQFRFLRFERHIFLAEPFNRGRHIAVEDFVALLRQCRAERMAPEQLCETELSWLDLRKDLFNKIGVNLLGLRVVRVTSHCDETAGGFFA